MIVYLGASHLADRQGVTRDAIQARVRRHPELWRPDVRVGVEAGWSPARLDDPTGTVPADTVRYLGLEAVAGRLGVPLTTISGWISRHDDFPAPDAAVEDISGDRHIGWSSARLRPIRRWAAPRLGRPWRSVDRPGGISDEELVRLRDQGLTWAAVGEAAVLTKSGAWARYQRIVSTR